MTQTVKAGEQSVLQMKDGQLIATGAGGTGNNNNNGNGNGNGGGGNTGLIIGGIVLLGAGIGLAASGGSGS
ncbi:MAG: hypothetical protein U5J63_03945 [Fodinibius sp.]|nr:hypothetical protein [Fodinibius sp.]